MGRRSCLKAKRWQELARISRSHVCVCVTPKDFNQCSNCEVQQA